MKVYLSKFILFLFTFFSLNIHSQSKIYDFTNESDLSGWMIVNDDVIKNLIKKVDLAKDSADARPEVFSPGNALDAKITELDLKIRKIKLSVKAAQIDEEKSLIAKFGEGATKSGATLKGIFEKAIGKKEKKEK